MTDTDKDILVTLATAAIINWEEDDSEYTR